jgi:hypothetical protein
MPSRWLRACGVVLGIGFGVNALAPGLPHGCQPDAAGIAPHHQTSETPVTAGPSHGHEHKHTPSAPSKAPNCCVGHSCCVARVAAPAAPSIVIPVLQAVLSTPVVVRTRPPRPLPRYTLPVANAPPLLA